jgi:adenylate kinase family enzyme
MRKILILGCSGAGKSTLARQIGRVTGLPVIHLDQHYWLPGWQEPDKETWHRKVGALIAQPRWVMDGNFGGTLVLRLAAADTAIFLDFPTRVCLGRVLLRVIRSLGRIREDMAPGCPERFDFSFLRYVYRYRHDDRSRHLAAVEAFGGKLVILRRPAEVADFLHGLGQTVPGSEARETANDTQGVTSGVRSAGSTRSGSHPDLR